MGTCGSCFGAGTVICSACSGRGHVSRFGMDGVETTTCAVCGGRRRMRCDFCHGTGQVGTSGGAAGQTSPEALYHAATSLWVGSGYSNPGMAIQLFSQAIALDAANANTYHARGKAYYQMGDYQSALKDYDRAINLYPNDGAYHNDKGIAWEALGNLAKAQRSWKKAVELGDANGQRNLDRVADSR